MNRKLERKCQVFGEWKLATLSMNNTMESSSVTTTVKHEFHQHFLLFMKRSDVRFYFLFFPSSSFVACLSTEINDIRTHTHKHTELQRTFQIYFSFSCTQQHGSDRRMKNCTHFVIFHSISRNAVRHVVDKSTYFLHISNVQTTFGWVPMLGMLNVDSRGCALFILVTFERMWMCVRECIVYIPVFDSLLTHRVRLC